MKLVCPHCNGEAWYTVGVFFSGKLVCEKCQGLFEVKSKDAKIESVEKTQEGPGKVRTC